MEVDPFLTVIDDVRLERLGKKIKELQMEGRFQLDTGLIL